MFTCCRRALKFNAPEDDWTTADLDMQIVWESCMLSRAIYFWTGAETALGAKCDWNEMKQIAAASGPEDQRLHASESLLEKENDPKIRRQRNFQLFVHRQLFEDAADVHNTLAEAFRPLGPDATLEMFSDPARCILFCDPARRRIIVVFRGTADLADVKDDLHLAHQVVPDPFSPGLNLNKDVESNDINIANSISGSRVVSGFVEHFTRENAHRSIRNAIQTCISREGSRGSEHTVQDIFITGHSLGAATAALLAATLRKEPATPRITLTTFGCPRVGNSDFGRELLEKRDGWANVRHWRVQNQMDIIARIPYWLPPCFNDWKHAQTRHIWLRRDKLVKKKGEILLASSPVNSFSSCFALSSSSPAVHKLGGARGYVKYLRPWKDASNHLKDSSSSSSEKHEEEEYSISHTKQTSTEI